MGEMKSVSNSGATKRDYLKTYSHKESEKKRSPENGLGQKKADKRHITPSHRKRGREVKAVTVGKYERRGIAN